MNRGYHLSSGLSNLSDQVRVLDRDGSDLGFMPVAEAQKRASDQAAELAVIERIGNTTVVRIVQVRKI